MAKTNYTKVEELLIQGQERLKIQGWIDQTKEETTPEDLNPKTYLIHSLEYGLDLLPPDDEKFIELVGITKDEIVRLVGKPETLSEKDWQIVKDIRLKLKEYLAQIADKMPILSDEELVESERIKHKNKRFNKREKWLPLH